jgi:hypothetical protein
LESISVAVMSTAWAMLVGVKVGLVIIERVNLGEEKSGDLYGPNCSFRLPSPPLARTI